jgi:hypothetical protein
MKCPVSFIYRQWFAEYGLRVVQEEFIPEDGGGHTLLLGQKTE